MSSASQKKTWATPARWEEMMETIIRLYSTENRPLAQVMDIMSREYGFHATARMYKTRFKAWGLAKYSKESRGDSVGTSSLVAHRGREVGALSSGRTARHATRSVSTNSTQVVLPPLNFVRMPAELQGAEISIRSITYYTRNRFQTSSWVLDENYNASQETAAPWLIYIELTTRLLKHRREWPEAFMLLRKCFLNLEFLIDHQHPGLMSALFLSSLGLTDIGLELATLLFRYTAQMCTIKLGASHPIAVILSQIITLGWKSSARLMSEIMAVQYAGINANAHPNNCLEAHGLVHRVRNLVRNGTMTLSGAQDAFAERTRQMMQSSTSRLATIWRTWVKLHMARLCCDQGAFPEAYHIIFGAEGGGLEKVDDGGVLAEDRLLMRGQILTGLGRFEEAAEYFERLLKISQEDQNASNCQKMCIAWEVHNQYRLAGSSVGAERAMAFLERALEDLLSNPWTDDFGKLTRYLGTTVYTPLFMSHIRVSGLYMSNPSSIGIPK